MILACTNIDLNCLDDSKSREITLKTWPFNAQNSNNTDLPVFYNTHIVRRVGNAQCI